MGDLSKWPPVLSSCGLLVAVAGGPLPVLVGSLVAAALSLGWSGLVACCGGVGGVLSTPAVGPVVAAPRFACPGSAVGVGCVVLFPFQRPLLCLRPHGQCFAPSPAAGWCLPNWGGLLPGLVLAPWPLWSAFSLRGLPLGWVGYPPSFLVVNPACALRGLSWLEGLVVFGGWLFAFVGLWLLAPASTGWLVCSGGMALVHSSPLHAFVCGVESAPSRMCSGRFLLACGWGYSSVP